MPDVLLKTKLFAPPPAPNHVQRKLLLEKLNRTRQMGLPFALISAPAGFGKTTLISNWTRSSKLPFAWFALDEGAPSLFVMNGVIR